MSPQNNYHGPHLLTALDKSLKILLRKEGDLLKHESCNYARHEN